MIPTDREPPWSRDAEVAVLGGMLIDRDAIAVALEMLTPEAFHLPAHRRLYRAAIRVWERGDALDPVTWSEDLTSHGELDAAGGMDYLGELVGSVPTAANVRYHCAIVRDKAGLRRVLDTASNLIRAVHDADADDVRAELAVLTERLLGELESRGRSGGFRAMADMLWPALEALEKMQASAGGVTGLPTGFRDLDTMTAGFQTGDLVIVAARPSMGKTAWASDVLRHLAIAHSTPCAISSLEMSAEQMVQRMLAAEGRIDLLRMRRGKLSQEEHQRLATAAGHLNTAPIYVDDEPVASVVQLRAKARRLVVEHGIRLLAVDYLQLMDDPQAESRVQAVSAISRGLKAIARESGIVVLALSQLSRAVEARQSKRPMLSDLRDSGTIEQDADVVLFLYRPEMYAKDPANVPESLEGKAELIVGKQRNGPTGVVGLHFTKSHARFDGVARDYRLPID